MIVHANSEGAFISLEPVPNGWLNLIPRGQTDLIRTHAGRRRAGIITKKGRGEDGTQKLKGIATEVDDDDGDDGVGGDCDDDNDVNTSGKHNSQGIHRNA